MLEHVTVFERATETKVEAKLVIRGFVRELTLCEPGKGFLSDTFMVGDTPMALKVYPNGHTDEHKGHVSVFLKNNSNVDVTVQCQMHTDAKTEQFDHVVEAEHGYGFGNFLTHAECTQEYSEKDFVVTATVEVPGESLKIPGGNSAGGAGTTKFNVWERVYENMQHTDFKLIFAGEEVPCHKHILAAASPVLQAMVENQHRESIESRANIKLSGEVGRAFVKLIYTGCLDEELLKEQAQAFLELGEMYNLPHLKDKAEAEMLKQLKKETMVQFLSIGDFFGANKIFEAALMMTKANMGWLRGQVRCKKNIVLQHS